MSYSRKRSSFNRCSSVQSGIGQLIDHIDLDDIPVSEKDKRNSGTELVGITWKWSPTFPEIRGPGI